MQRDVLIVGFGLAGWALTEVCKQKGMSFVVFDPLQNTTSRVATGIYNPVVLKRFTAIWEAKALMEHALPIYSNSSNSTAQTAVPINRIFSSAAEQNKWIVATDTPVLSSFLDPNIQKNTNININATFGMGKVLHTGWIDTDALLTTAQESLSEQLCFEQEYFDYNQLSWTSNSVRYKHWHAKNIVFAEGLGVLKNPWFSSLPILPNKGEWLLVRCEGLHLTEILKGSVFVVPLGNDTYRVGATYARDFENTLPSEGGKEWLINQFKKLINLPFEILHHGAGLRPTVPDRRPIVGPHPKYHRLWCINGLGSRGVLWAPYVANLTVLALNDASSIPETFHIDRFFSNK